MDFPVVVRYNSENNILYRVREKEERALEAIKAMLDVNHGHCRVVESSI